MFPHILWSSRTTTLDSNKAATIVFYTSQHNTVIQWHRAHEPYKIGVHYWHTAFPITHFTTAHALTLYASYTLNTFILCHLSSNCDHVTLCRVPWESSSLRWWWQRYFSRVLWVSCSLRWWLQSYSVHRIPGDWNSLRWWRPRYGYHSQDKTTKIGVKLTLLHCPESDRKRQIDF